MFRRTGVPVRGSACAAIAMARVPMRRRALAARDVEKAGRARLPALFNLGDPTRSVARTNFVGSRERSRETSACAPFKRRSSQGRRFLLSTCESRRHGGRKGGSASGPEHLPSSACSALSQPASSPSSDSSAPSSRSHSGRCGGLCRRSRAFSLCLAVALALCAGIGIDAAVNGSTMRAGVSIGEVDVSGMTREQALDAVNATYESRLSQGSAVVFSDEETAASVDLAAQLAQDDAIAEQISFDEAQKSKKLWQVDASSLGAVLPSYQLVDEAFSIGRGPADAFERIGAAFGGASVDVRLDFDDVRLEELAHDIDRAIGVVRVDYDVRVEDGAAVVVEGHDGDMVNRETFAQKLTTCLLSSDPPHLSSPPWSMLRCASIVTAPKRRAMS